MKNKKGHIANVAMCPFTICSFKRFVNTNEIHQLRLRCSVPKNKSIVALIGGKDDNIADGGSDGFGIVAQEPTAVYISIIA